MRFWRNQRSDIFTSDAHCFCILISCHTVYDSKFVDGFAPDFRAMSLSSEVLLTYVLNRQPLLHSLQSRSV